MNNPDQHALRLTRRAFLGRSGAGLGAMALATLLNPVRAGGTDRWRGVVTQPHVAPRARRVIWLYMAGGAATFFKDAAKRGTQLIVIDPRRPQIADFASWYCRLNPGTDVAFYNGLMHVLIAEGLIDRAFLSRRTENFEALRDLVADYSPERVAPVCGLSAETIRAIARAIGRARALMIFWGMGIS